MRFTQKKAAKAIAVVTTVVMAVAIWASVPIAGVSGEAYAADKEHYTLHEVTDAFSKELSGDQMLLNDAFVYKGWRTSNGNWLHGVIYEIEDRLKELGFSEGERSTKNNRGDSYWLQTNANATAWNPQYVAVKIAEPSIPYTKKPKEVVNASGEPYTGITTFRKSYPEFESRSTLTNDEKALCANTIEFKADCIDPTSMYYPEHMTPEYMVNALKNPGSQAYEEMQEVNQRVFMPTNGTFFAYTDKSKTAAQNIAAGTKTGEVVYVGTLTASSNSEGIPAADLAGKILLTTTTATANVKTYAKSVGAIAALCRRNPNPDYHMPVVDGKRWYTDYVPYGGGAGWEAPGADVPVVLHWSLDKYDALTKLMGEGPVKLDVSALGTYEASVPREMLVAEIQGATKPEERIYIPAHINEPGAHDNASGVAMGMEIIETMMKMIHEGKIARPDRTITFVFGDEITMTNNWEAKYRNEFLNVKGSIDLDMTGADPVKVGGNMLIEKTPDPSDVATTAVRTDLRYRYGNFTYPGQANLPLNYGTVNWSSVGLGNAVPVFARTPDKFSLWTGGTSSVTTPVNNYPGLFLNDLYLQTALIVQEKNPEFKVNSNPYEGGSDHSPFVTSALGRVGTFIPALLTWHFTDYVYHSSHDTLDKLSAQECHDVATVSAAVAYQMANAGETEATDTIGQVMKSWKTRLGYEKKNAEDHYAFREGRGADAALMQSAYEAEIKAVGDWSRWYMEAVRSPARFMVGGKLGTPFEVSKKYQEAEDAAVAKINADTIAALENVDVVFNKNSAKRPKQIAVANLAEPVKVSSGSNAAGIYSQLPKKIKVEYVGGGTGEVNVTWNAMNPSFNEDREGLYRITGTLSGLADGVVNWAALQGVAEVNARNVGAYNLIFDSKGGTKFDSQRYFEDETIGPLPTPTKDGYHFVGWFTDNNIYKNEFKGTNLDEHTTLFAKWALPDDIEGATVDSVKDQVYDGKDKTPKLTVKLGSDELVEDTDFTVTYADNKAIGKAKATITGINKYFGKKAVTFKIVPKATSVTKAIAGKKKMTVRWKKVAGDPSEYQIAYKVKGTKKWKSKAVSGKKSSLVIKKLKAGKKYEVRARSYKTVEKVKYYSAWSKVKTSKKIKK